MQKRSKKWIKYPIHLYEWLVKWKIIDNIILDIILTIYDSTNAHFCEEPTRKAISFIAEIWKDDKTARVIDYVGSKEIKKERKSNFSFVF